MNIVVYPTFVIIQGKKKRYVYCCPKCKIRLTSRSGMSGFLRSILPWVPLKRYQCKNCLNKYLVCEKYTPVPEILNFTELYSRQKESGAN